MVISHTRPTVAPVPSASQPDVCQSGLPQSVLSQAACAQPLPSLADTRSESETEPIAAPVPLPFQPQISEALWRLQYGNPRLVDTVPDIIYIYDLVEQRTIYSSREVADLLGYTTAEMEARGLTGLAELIHPEDVERVAHYFQRFNTLLPGEVIELEYRMQRSDGTWSWLYSQETRFSQAVDDQCPRQVLGMMQDLTKRQASSVVPHPAPKTVKQLLEKVIHPLSVLRSL